MPERKSNRSPNEGSIATVAGRLRCDDGRENDRLAVGRHDCAVCLARDFSCFKFEGTSTPVQFYGLNIEHSVFLSWTRENDESHEQDGKMLTSTAMS